MEREDLRLECVKLTYTHGRSPAEAVGSAKLLEDYILSKPQPSRVSKVSVPKKVRQPKKKADNLDILS